MACNYAPLIEFWDDCSIPPLVLHCKGDKLVKSVYQMFYKIRQDVYKIICLIYIRFY